MKRSGMRRKISLCGMMVLFGLTAVSAQGADYVSVVKDGVNLRSGPDTKFEVLFQLPARYPLKVLSRQGKWIKVSDYESDKGWVYAPLVDTSRHVIVRVKTGNIRKGPGQKFDKIGTVTREVILKELERKGDWVKISHPDLKEGWIHRKLVWP